MSARIPPEAFEYYAGLGPSRSYKAVAERFGVSKRAVVEYARVDQWQERLAALEAKAKENSEQRILESLEAMNERHLKSLRVVQGKALEALKGMSLTTAMDAIRALDLAIKRERTIRGEPGDRTAISVEDVVRREFDAWMIDGEDEGDEDEEPAV